MKIIKKIETVEKVNYSVEVCCETMEKKYNYQQLKLEKGELGVWTPETQENVVFNYCPFCGNKVTTVIKRTDDNVTVYYSNDIGDAQNSAYYAGAEDLLREAEYYIPLAWLYGFVYNLWSRHTVQLTDEQIQEMCEVLLACHEGYYPPEEDDD